MPLTQEKTLGATLSSLFGRVVLEKMASSELCSWEGWIWWQRVRMSSEVTN